MLRTKKEIFALFAKLDETPKEFFEKRSPPTGVPLRLLTFPVEEKQFFEL